jgi:hypothetical protein
MIQIVVNSFLSQIWKSINGTVMTHFCLNGRHVSSKNFKWMKSNTGLKYINFVDGYPDADPIIVVDLNENEMIMNQLIVNNV